MADAGEMLTEDEQRAVHLAGELMGLLNRIVADGPTRDADLRELVGPVHVLQNAVLAQAAARAYPERYRLMGKSALSADYEKAGA